KKKRMYNYHMEWETMYNWIQKSYNCTTKVLCTVCKKEFSISHGGEADVKHHANGKQHAQNCKRQKQKHTAHKPDDTLNEKVVAAELTQAYHTVFHHHSYQSGECESKLFSTLFLDSTIVKNIHCGCMKAETLVKSVLAPLSLEFVDEFRKSEGPYFSISTDASNKGNVKMYPLVVRYWTLEQGLQDKLLKTFTKTVMRHLFHKLSSHKLTLEKVSSYCADNAIVNCSKRNFMYQKLTKENPNILPANCPAHLLHNVVKHANNTLKVDVETLVIKTFNHFSSLAKRVTEQREIFDFVDLEYASLHHVPTRWLSLLPAINRLLSTWKAVKCSFVLLSPEDCPHSLWNLFAVSENGTVEIHLYFLQNILKVFNDAVLSLENANTTACELYAIMDGVQTKLYQRKSDQVPKKTSDKISQNVTKLPSNTWRSGFSFLLMTTCTRSSAWLSKVIEIWSAKIFLKLSLPPLAPPLAVTATNLQNATDQDEPYDEFCSIKQIVKKLEKEKKSVSDIWSEVFKKGSAADFTNMKKLISLVLSIPVNAYTECIFSLLGSGWTDVRNRCAVDLIKCETQVKMNFNMSCKDFYHFILGDKDVVRNAKSSNKYE
uniref:HAT C-terminal dimerisation domain-containing protein n=1 Tax=Latimeria chalumnae TaxID=7897 RepID=H3B080_LATCH